MFRLMREVWSTPEEPVSWWINRTIFVIGPAIAMFVVAFVLLCLSVEQLAGLMLY